MKKSGRITVIIFMFMISMDISNCFSFDQQDQTLKGLWQVALNVVANEAENRHNFTGSNPYVLKNEVEIMLRQSGIQINENADAKMNVSITMQDADSTNQPNIIGVYGIVSMTLYQRTQLIRDQRIRSTSVTWESPVFLLIGPPDNFSNRCRQKVRYLMQQFLTAHASVNSK